MITKSIIKSPGIPQYILIGLTQNEKWPNNTENIYKSSKRKLWYSYRCTSYLQWFYSNQNKEKPSSKLEINNESQFSEKGMQGQLSNGGHLLLQAIKIFIEFFIRIFLDKNLSRSLFEIYKSEHAIFQRADIF